MKLHPPQEWGREVLGALPNEQRYLVGVSGGRDSVVLLHWLLSLGYRRLIVCHFEHGLRGRAGKADARFVARLAKKSGLKFDLGSAEVASLAAERRQSIETAARAERLRFFQTVARRRRCRTIFLAHHADDQVETFLLNLFRGAGARGLGAMRPRTRIGLLEIVRPLLALWRSEIDRYAAQHRLKFRDDASNEQLHARRNRLRHKIIPQLEKEFGREIRRTIWRSATILADEEEFLETQCPVALTNHDQLAVAALGKLAPALQRRVIRQWLLGRGVAAVGFDVVEAARNLLSSEVPAKINLSRDRHLRRRAGRIFIE
ncbi:MAG TPA: tRNA lysidine(34) synthetase TilS [Chthoniobacterales bacterium]